MWCCSTDIVKFYSQIKEKLEKVVAKQQELLEKWDKHWEVLQQCECTHLHRLQTLKDTHIKNKSICKVEEKCKMKELVEVPYLLMNIIFIFPVFP